MESDKILKSCPVCGKIKKNLSLHFTKVDDAAHEKFLERVYFVVDPLLSENYLFEIISLIEEQHEEFASVCTERFLALRREALGISGRKVVGKRRLGECNPAKNTEVRIKISDAIKEMWKSGDYSDRINGMMGVCGSDHPGWKDEKHTPLYFAEKNYREFLGHFQDITQCSCCGKICETNVHHIDENHENFLISNLEPLCISCHADLHYGKRKMPYVTIGKFFRFAGAHFLPTHPRLCKHWHGHEWRMEVQIMKRVDKTTGMVLDFSDLKKAVKSCIVDKLDHNMLNDFLVNPTAENILVWCWERLMFDGLLKGIKKITLWEAEDSWASLDVDGMLSVFRGNIENYVEKEWYEA
jgi:6-pyruvoyltetrahydropterin/6-carboxytetrahydropterin synthase